MPYIVQERRQNAGYEKIASKSHRHRNITTHHSHIPHKSIGWRWRLVTQYRRFLSLPVVLT